MALFYDTDTYSIGLGTEIQKAYDTADRELLWEMLARFGVP